MIYLSKFYSILENSFYDFDLAVRKTVSVPTWLPIYYASMRKNNI